MIELREDGSQEGEPTMGRIYVMASDGVLRYCSSEVERASDWPDYIEKYANFRGFKTGFLDMKALDEAHSSFITLGFSTEDQVKEMALHLRRVMVEKQKELERAAHAYFAACPAGQERIVASDIYEDVRNLLRDRV